MERKQGEKDNFGGAGDQQPPAYSVGGSHGRFAVHDTLFGVGVSTSHVMYGTAM